MKVYRPYLVVWQLGSNEHSLTHTPLDVLIYADYNARERLEAIKKELDHKNGKEYENIRILSIGQL